MSDTQTRPNGPTDEELLTATPGGKTGQEAWVGFFVLLGIVSSLIILFWMTDPATLRGRYMLVTTVSDAGGIRAGDPVQMNGVNLGRIHDFEMVEVGVVHITMEIYNRWQVPVGSHTEMGAAGIFGGRTLQIIPTNAAQFHAEMDTIPAMGTIGDGLLGSVDQLSAQAGTVLERIELLLNQETLTTVGNSAESLEAMLAELSAMATEQRAALGELTASLTSAASGIEDATGEVGPDIASAVARADSAMATLTQTGEKLDAATESLRSVLARMDRGEGTLGRLSTDETLYVTLNETALSLKTLLDDLQENPNKYINISIF